MTDWVPIYPIVQQINLLPLLQPFYTLLQPLWCSSLDPTTKHCALGLPANLGQLANILALRGPSRVRASMVSLLVCLKTRRFFVKQVRWLSFGGLLVNLSVLHHERVTSLLCSLIHSSPGVQGSTGVWFGSLPTSTYMYIYLLCCQNCRVCRCIPGIPCSSTTEIMTSFSFTFILLETKKTATYNTRCRSESPKKTLPNTLRYMHSFVQVIFFWRSGDNMICGY